MICNLCPRACGAERTTEQGDGVCRQPMLPVAAKAMLHQWEEPCLVGDHGAGCVFFSGCNLRCCFCQNGSISQGTVGKPITADRLREIFKELIEQGEEMAMLHPASVNSVRMLTINLGEGDIRLWYPYVRIGVGGNFISSAAAGSIVAGINVGTGVVETTGFNKLGGITDVHPDTHFTIKGIKIPRWRQLCQKAIEMSERLPTLRYIGWDFVYDKDGEWIVMEGNENAGISSSQLIHHRGMREELEQLIGYHPTKEYWWQGKYPSRFENIK